jgi:shikimate kinase
MGEKSEPREEFSASCKPIVLIGPMGAGKTTIGGLLAKRLCREFIDSDQVLEARTGVSIATIFEIEGEQAFRDREASILDELSLADGTNVLSTGGGAMMRESTRQLLRQRGVVIYLHALPQVSYDRVKRSKDRPMLGDANVRERLIALYEQRHPVYLLAAHIVVEASREKPAYVVDEIVCKLQEHVAMSVKP